MSQKILVVDDELEIVKVVRAYLEQSGFRVITASDGQQALAVFRHEQPDLIVLDLNLPQTGWPRRVPRDSPREQRAHHHADGARRRNRSADRPRNRRG